MDAVRFTLSGKTAFFKKPDVNSYFYFSYGMIHRVAVLGILGAILGYGGYNQQKAAQLAAAVTKKKSNADASGPQYPEFYERLAGLKIAIVPGYHSIPKKMQIFNNSVGYASSEQGGNLIVKEQWLENPSWDIYVAIENEAEEAVANALLSRCFVYLPYLGKNDHPADICDVERLIGIEECKPDSEGRYRVDSLFIRGEFTLVESDPLDDLDMEKEPLYKYEEKLPASLSEETNSYQLKTYLLTNSYLNKVAASGVYDSGKHRIVWI